MLRIALLTFLFLGVNPDCFSAMDAESIIRKHEVLRDSSDTGVTMVKVERLRRMSNEERRIARNTIFAQHGRVFRSQDLQEHFEAQDWYAPDPNYSDDRLNDEERDLVKVIRMWEQSSDLKWHSFEDLDGDGEMDFTYVLQVDTQYCVLINDQIQMIPSYPVPAGFGDNGRWGFQSVRLRSIDQSTGTKQLVLSQRDPDAEDPPLEHWIIQYDGHSSRSLPFGDDDYNGGDLFIDGEGHVQLVNSWCGTRTRTYFLQSGNLVLISEEYIPSPYPCAACVSGDVQITMTDGTTRRMSELSVGMKVRGYHLQESAWGESEVESLVQVRHNHLVRYAFDGHTVVATDDHPFFAPSKGWVSLQPEKTKRNYRDYEGVQQLEMGDAILSEAGLLLALMSTSVAEGGETYSIETLHWGHGFLANGILVGTAQVKRDRAQD